MAQYFTDFKTKRNKTHGHMNSSQRHNHLSIDVYLFSKRKILIKTCTDISSIIDFPSHKTSFCYPIGQIYQSLVAENIMQTSKFTGP